MYIFYKYYQFIKRISIKNFIQNKNFFFKITRKYFTNKMPLLLVGTRKHKKDNYKEIYCIYYT